MTWLTVLTISEDVFFIEINCFYVKHFKCTILQSLTVLVKSLDDLMCYKMILKGTF